jgi:hypothetical protein
LLQGLIKVLLLYSGKGLVTLGYGKEGMAAREKLGKSSNGLAFAFGALVLIWLFFGLFFYFVFSGSSDSAISLAIIVVCPLIYAIWAIVARKSVPKLIEDASKVTAAQ